LKNLNDLSPEISEECRRRNSNTSCTHFSAETKDKDPRHYSANVFKFNNPFQTPKCSSPLGSHTNVMKMIRGGGGKDNFCFFNKMLDNNEENNYNKYNIMSNRNDLDKFKKDKLEKELKYLDSDDNNSKDSDSIEVSCFTMADTTGNNKDSQGKTNVNANLQSSSAKKKSSIWKTLAKIITK
jgi:hypothetical protein